CLPAKPEHETPVVITKTYDFVLWLLPKVEKFSRSFRFTIGERLSAHGLDLLVLLVEAAYATRKEDLLEGANRKVNGARYLLRLSKDLQLMSIDSYGYAAERLDEIGRMVGGWRKSLVRKA
ncbi:MAG: diversity-generating retroelement protein Avd, partial [Bryobacteraceae bacterium]